MKRKNVSYKKNVFIFFISLLNWNIKSKSFASKIPDVCLRWDQKLTVHKRYFDTKCNMKSNGLERERSFLIFLRVFLFKSTI